MGKVFVLSCEVPGPAQQNMWPGQSKAVTVLFFVERMCNCSTWMCWGTISVMTAAFIVNGGVVKSQRQWSVTTLPSHSSQSCTHTSVLVTKWWLAYGHSMCLFCLGIYFQSSATAFAWLHPPLTPTLVHTQKKFTNVKKKHKNKKLTKGLFTPCCQM